MCLDSSRELPITAKEMVHGQRGQSDRDHRLRLHSPSPSSSPRPPPPTTILNKKSPISFDHFRLSSNNSSAPSANLLRQGIHEDFCVRRGSGRGSCVRGSLSTSWAELNKIWSTRKLDAKLLKVQFFASTTVDSLEVQPR